MSIVAGPSYFEDRIIFHTHIAKSGGTSILDALTHMLGRASVMNINLTPDPPIAASLLGDAQRQALKVLSGHFWHGRQEQYFERKPVYVAAVRDPIDRFVSLFNFVLAGTGHPLRDEFESRGPDRSARWFFIEHPRFVNEIANSLGVPHGGSPIDWLEAHYAIVAPTARVDSLIAGLYRFFAPEIEPQIYRSNIAAGSCIALSAEVAEECRAASATDTLLCQQVEERYDDWLHDLGSRLLRAGPMSG